MAEQSSSTPGVGSARPSGWVRSSVTWAGVVAGFVAARVVLRHETVPPSAPPSAAGPTRDAALAALETEVDALDRELARLLAIVGPPSEPAESRVQAPAAVVAAAVATLPGVEPAVVEEPFPRRRTSRRLRKRQVRIVLETVVVVVAAFLLAMVIQLFLVKPFFIPSASMVPTLQMGDRVLVNRLAYEFGAGPQRGDVVVFLSPVPGYTDLIKRVVAVAGDRVAVHDGRLWIDGKAQAEPYVNDGGTAGSMPERTVPPGKVFVMGDNRNDSADSRVFGPIGEGTIVGKALVVYWPLGHFGGVTARTEQVAGTAAPPVRLQSGP